MLQLEPDVVKLGEPTSKTQYCLEGCCCPVLIVQCLLLFSANRTMLAVNTSLELVGIRAGVHK